MKKMRILFVILIACFLANMNICLLADEGDRGDLNSIISSALDSFESAQADVITEQEEIANQQLVQQQVEEQPLPEELKEVKIEQKPFEEDSSEKIILDTLELSGMDILAVLKLISKKSGLNIVAGKNVSGKVTIFLKDVEVRDALNIILSANSLGYIEKDGIIHVMTDRDYELIIGKKFGDKSESKIIKLEYAAAADTLPILNQMKSVVGKVLADEQSNTLVLVDTRDNLRDMEALIKKIDVRVTTKVFDLNYSKAEELEKQVSEVLTKNLGSIKIDTRTNKVIIKDTPKKIEEIKSIIDAFDERHKEVLIEAKIVKVILSEQFKMGVDWEYIFSQYHNLHYFGNFDIMSATDKFSKLSVGTLESDGYSAFIEVLETIGETNTLSSPRITAINNEEAKILVGSSEPYVTTTTTTTASGPSTTAETVNFIDVGVKLYVTPTINQDNFVTMKIKPEVSSVNTYLTTSENNRIPIVESSEAETSIMVKDGVTIVIGGLIKDEKIKTINKTPLLGDIPVLGALFRNIDDLERKTELIIFLTPHIISGEGNGVGFESATSLDSL